MDVSPLAFASDSTLPTFPQVPLVYALGVVVATLLTGGIAWLRFRTDRALHSPEQAAALLEIPIIGAVVEIRSREGEARRRLWNVAIRPAVALVLLAVMVGSAALCYRHLADSSFAQTVHDRGIRTLLSSRGSRGGLFS